MHKILLLFFTQFLFLYYNNNLTKDNIPQIDILSPEEFKKDYEYGHYENKSFLQFICYRAKNNKKLGHKESVIFLNFLKDAEKKTISEKIKSVIFLNFLEDTEKKTISETILREKLSLLLPKYMSLANNIKFQEYKDNEERNNEYLTYTRQTRELNCAIKEDFEESNEDQKNIINACFLLLNLYYKR